MNCLKSVVLAINLLCFSNFVSHGQANNDFCSSFSCKDAAKFKKELSSFFEGQSVFRVNGVTDYTSTLDHLRDQLLSCPNILDADWDRCRYKIASFPGEALFAIHYKHNDQVHSICLQLQLGKFHHNRTIEEITVVDLKDCDKGFIETERQWCEQIQYEQLKQVTAKGTVVWTDKNLALTIDNKLFKIAFAPAHSLFVELTIHTFQSEISLHLNCLDSVLNVKRVYGVHNTPKIDTPDTCQFFHSLLSNKLSSTSSFLIPAYSSFSYYVEIPLPSKGLEPMLNLVLGGSLYYEIEEISNRLEVSENCQFLFNNVSANTVLDNSKQYFER